MAAKRTAGLSAVTRATLNDEELVRINFNYKIKLYFQVIMFISDKPGGSITFRKSILTGLVSVDF